MPRRARLDAPGTPHHVILRDLERGADRGRRGRPRGLRDPDGDGRHRHQDHALRRGHAPQPRHLAIRSFVERSLAEADARLQSRRVGASRLGGAAAIVHAGCQQAGISAEQLQMGARLAVRFVTPLGLPLAETARHLGAGEGKHPGRARLSPHRF